MGAGQVQEERIKKVETGVTESGVHFEVLDENDQNRPLVQDDEAFQQEEISNYGMGEVVLVFV